MRNIYTSDPFFFNSFNSANKLFVSLSVNEAVGSSKMRIFAFLTNALAISINCCFPTPRCFIFVKIFRSSNFNFLREFVIPHT
jgi:hypothetical protein